MGGSDAEREWEEKRRREEEAAIDAYENSAEYPDSELEEEDDEVELEEEDDEEMSESKDNDDPETLLEMTEEEQAIEDAGLEANPPAEPPSEPARPPSPWRKYLPVDEFWGEMEEEEMGEDEEAVAITKVEKLQQEDSWGNDCQCNHDDEEKSSDADEEEPEEEECDDEEDGYSVACSAFYYIPVITPL